MTQPAAPRPDRYAALRKNAARTASVWVPVPRQDLAELLDDYDRALDLVRKVQAVPMPEGWYTQAHALLHPLPHPCERSDCWQPDPRPRAALREDRPLAGRPPGIRRSPPMTDAQPDRYAARWKNQPHNRLFDGAPGMCLCAGCREILQRDYRCPVTFGREQCGDYRGHGGGHTRLIATVFLP